MQREQTDNFSQDYTRAEHASIGELEKSARRNTSGVEWYDQQYHCGRFQCRAFRLFSTMTAYAIHAYDFGLKKFIYPFILMIMMIPTQVTALGFIKLVSNMKLEDSFIPLIVPTIAAPVTFFYMKQYMESTLPLSLIEAARIDGSGEFRTFNAIVMPLMKPQLLCR